MEDNLNALDEKVDTEIGNVDEKIDTEIAKVDGKIDTEISKIQEMPLGKNKYMVIEAIR